MSLKFSQGIYQVKNTEKYLGNNNPRYRSGWELTFMMFCDNNPSVHEWASESIKIPYKDPLSGKNTIYVPDFLIVYLDKHQHKHAELIEIKPANQSLRERVGKNVYNQAQYVKNMAKWSAARAWCQQHGLKFRVINEQDIYHTGKKKNK
jgi:hypothetical protein